MARRGSRSHARLLALGLAVLLLSLLPFTGLASASTTVTPFRASAGSGVTRAAAGAPASVKLVGVALVQVTRTVPGPTAQAGTPAAGTVGIAGATTKLPQCLRAPCVDNYRGAGQPALVRGHWAEEIQLTVVQPSTRLGTASGFAVEVAVHLPLAWLFVSGYFSTGTTRSPTNQTVQLHLWVDLLSAVRPAPPPLEVVVMPCSSAGTCP